MNKLPPVYPDDDVPCFTSDVSDYVTDRLNLQQAHLDPYLWLEVIQQWGQVLHIAPAHRMFAKPFVATIFTLGVIRKVSVKASDRLHFYVLDKLE